MGDLDAAAEWAARQGGGGPLGITGFCWGGRIAWLYAAHNPALKAGVASVQTLQWQSAPSDQPASTQRRGAAAAIRSTTVSMPA